MINKTNYHINTNANFISDESIIIQNIGITKFRKINRLGKLLTKINRFNLDNNLKINWDWKPRFVKNENYNKKIFDKFMPKLINLNNKFNKLSKEIKFDYESKNSFSKYIYTKNGVIRFSDHWGKNIRSCNWYLLKEEVKEYCYYKITVAFAEFKNFKGNN